MFSALSNEAVQQVAEVVKQTLAGTPDAARKEPFTWIMMLGVVGCAVAIILIFVVAAYYLLKQHNKATRETTDKFADVVRASDQQRMDMANSCHAAQIEAMRMAHDASSKAAEASNRSSSALENCTTVLNQVVQKLA